MLENFEVFTLASKGWPIKIEKRCNALHETMTRNHQYHLFYKLTTTTSSCRMKNVRNCTRRGGSFANRSLTTYAGSFRDVVNFYVKGALK